MCFGISISFLFKLFIVNDDDFNWDEFIWLLLLLVFAFVFGFVFGFGF